MTTLIIALILILLCFAGMGIGYLITGKQKLSCKKCGNPEQKQSCKRCKKK